MSTAPFTSRTTQLSPSGSRSTPARSIPSARVAASASSQARPAASSTCSCRRARRSCATRSGAAMRTAAPTTSPAETMIAQVRRARLDELLHDGRRRATTCARSCVRRSARARGRPRRARRRGPSCRTAASRRPESEDRPPAVAASSRRVRGCGTPAALIRACRDQLVMSSEQRRRAVEDAHALRLELVDDPDPVLDPVELGARCRGGSGRCRRVRAGAARRAATSSRERASGQPRAASATFVSVAWCAMTANSYESVRTLHGDAGGESVATRDDRSRPESIRSRCAARWRRNRRRLVSGRHRVRIRAAVRRRSGRTATVHNRGSPLRLTGRW